MPGSSPGMTRLEVPAPRTACLGKNDVPDGTEFA
jgi:hypothetical protein